MTAETEQASQERAWDLKERESTLEAKRQRSTATCAGMVSDALQLRAQPILMPKTDRHEGGMRSRLYALQRSRLGSKGGQHMRPSVTHTGGRSR